MKGLHLLEAFLLIGYNPAAGGCNMKLCAAGFLVSLILASTNVYALTVDEIIKLRQGGVSDETIQLLIRRDSDYRVSGTWKTKDGWIIHSTEMGGQRHSPELSYSNPYPIEVYPQVSPRHR